MEASSKKLKDQIETLMQDTKSSQGFFNTPEASEAYNKKSGDVSKDLTDLDGILQMLRREISDGQVNMNEMDKKMAQQFME
ncbi:hypothetical protein [Saccharopolyspora gloriosae]|uniref:hypothetical protein n=1 Tax=Saccharopolyspora gloriosae TaxID=455344 RepID=UPI001FB7DD80|nr:hypothetical protein [Saccharopolyspora gloriosae]